MDRYYGLIALVILLIVLVIFIKYQANKDEEQEDETVEEIRHEETVTACPLDTSDEDAVVASLIASIEMRNESHKNVQVISCRKVG